MDATAIHPNRALQEFFSGSFRRVAHYTAHWLATTDTTKLDWVPGEPGVTKARTILDQVSELVNVNRRQAATLRGESTENFERVTLKDGDEAKRALIASANEIAEAVAALDPAALDEEIDTFMGRIPRKSLLEIVLMNISYHGGVINAYQLMYGDEEFHIPPSP